VRIGFTGTRRGMTTKQLEALTNILEVEEPDVFVHGDCVGADAQAHVVAKELGWHVEIYPCNFERARAHCEGDYIAAPQDPLRRNEVIVRCTEILIATPNERIEVQRSGTWSTIRCARRIDRPRAILWPQGGWIWEA